MAEETMNMLMNLEMIHEKLGEELRKVHEKYGNKGINIAEKLLDTIIEKYSDIIKETAIHAGFKIRAIWGLIDVDEYGLPYITITLYDPTVKSLEEEETIEKYSNFITKLSESGDKFLEELVDNPYITLTINNIPPPKIRYFSQDR